MSGKLSNKSESIRKSELDGVSPRQTEVAGRRPRGVRAASERRPGGVREALERLPGGVRVESPKRVRKASVTEPGSRIKKSGQTARDCPIFSVRIVKLPSVFDDFDERRFFCTGTMDLRDFAKPPRLCRKFKTAAPVQKI